MGETKKGIEWSFFEWRREISSNLDEPLHGWYSSEGRQQEDECLLTVKNAHNLKRLKTVGVEQVSEAL
jgi:hypothetical protein